MSNAWQLYCDCRLLWSASEQIQYILNENARVRERGEASRKEHHKNLC